MRKQKRVTKKESNQVKTFGMVYQMPKKLDQHTINDFTPLLCNIKKHNPSMHVTIVHQNGIYAAVVHFDTYCFVDCHWNLQELDATIALQLIGNDGKYKNLIIPNDIF